MKTTHFVTKEQYDLCRHMETKLLDMPVSACILFAGVSIDETNTFLVFIGCDKTLEEEVARSVVQLTLREEIAIGIKMKIEVRRGCMRKLLTR